jgi:hypothetical protein
VRLRMGTIPFVREAGGLQAPMAGTAPLSRGRKILGLSFPQSFLDDVAARRPRFSTRVKCPCCLLRSWRSAGLEGWGPGPGAWVAPKRLATPPQRFPDPSPNPIFPRGMSASCARSGHTRDGNVSNIGCCPPSPAGSIWVQELSKASDPHSPIDGVTPSITVRKPPPIPTQWDVSVRQMALFID